MADVAAAAGAPSSYRATILADSPAIYWRMDDGAGTVAADSSGNGRNGTIGGSGSPSWVAGLIADDSDKAISTPGNVTVEWTDSAGTLLTASTDPFSIEFWFKNGGTADWGLLLEGRSGDLYIQKNGSTDEGYVAVYSSGGSYVTLTETSGLLFNGSSHHVVLTFDGTYCYFYIDGTLRATSAAVTGTVAGGPGFIFGIVSAAVGVVDEVAYYAACLSPTRITAHYNAGI